jgi:excinuclease UvrABC ATPase subunit
MTPAVRARLDQLEASGRAERALDAARGAVVLAARVGPESWRYDHLRRLLEQEATAAAALDVAHAALAAPLPPCPDCRGEGLVVTEIGPTRSMPLDCRACGGTGRLA